MPGDAAMTIRDLKRRYKLNLAEGRALPAFDHRAASPRGASPCGFQIGGSRKSSAGSRATRSRKPSTVVPQPKGPPRHKRHANRRAPTPRTLRFLTPAP